MQGMAGMGILAALMVVSVVTVIAVKQSWQNELDMLRSGHRWAGMQADAYIRGAEQLAVLVLEKDKQTNKFDSIHDQEKEFWNTPIESPTDVGALRIAVTDLQGRINLNALGTPDQKDPDGKHLGSALKYSEQQRRFIRFLQTIPLDDDGTVMDVSTAEGILDAVRDWVDADSNVSGFAGAEADYYSGLEVPISISNGPMTSTSELLHIKGMTPRLFMGLRPYVNVLPATAELNINTMDQVLTRGFGGPNDLQPLDETLAGDFYSDIASSAIEKSADIQTIPWIEANYPPSQNSQTGMDLSGLTVSSTWFEADITVSVGDHVRSGRALIDRNGNKVQVVRRSDSPF